MKIISAENISKSFGSNHLLRNISFSLKKGDALLIRGGNGTGKTTLSLICSQLMEVDSGLLTINGKPAAVADRINPFRELTARENISLAAGSVPEKILAYAEKLKFINYIDQRGDIYSSGTWQKLKLLIALAVNPDLLVFDEIFSYLDPPSTKAAMEIIRKEQSGRAMIITGNGKIEQELAKQVIILEQIH